MDKLSTSFIQLKKDLMNMRTEDIRNVISMLETKHSFKEDHDEFILKYMATYESDAIIPTVHETLESPKINYLKCRGKTQSGEQCSRNIKNSTLYCGSHMIKRPHGSFPL
jgi:hypothetical protein